MNAVIVPITPVIELKRILYATDFSEESRAALPVVAAIARHYGSRVFVAHTWAPTPYPMVAPEAVVLRRKQQIEARSELKSILRLPALQGVPAEIVLRRGAPGEQLQRVIKERNIDLAIVSTHGKTGFRHRVLGSVAEDLVRTLSCPVLTVGPHMANRFANLASIENILFPTDFSEQSLAVFPYLASLAHEYSARLTVLHVLPVEAAGNPDAKALAEPLRKRMEASLGHQISPQCHADYVIASGDTDATILDYARRTNADLIGLGVRCATDIGRRFRETVAYRILAEVECPVLTHHAVSRW